MVEERGAACYFQAVKETKKECSSTARKKRPERGFLIDDLPYSKRSSSPESLKHLPGRGLKEKPEGGVSKGTNS